MNTKGRTTYRAPERHLLALYRLSAEWFLALLKKRKGTLSNYCYHVTEYVCIENGVSKFSIHLGYGEFKNELTFKELHGLTYLSLGNSTINGTLRFEESRIDFLRFGSAKLHGQASLDDMESIHIDFGQARFNGEVTFNQIKYLNTFNLVKAFFETGLSLKEIRVANINAGSANLGKLTLKELYFETFCTGVATVSKLTIQEDKLSFRGNLLDTSRIQTQPDSEDNENSLATRIALAMEKMKNSHS